MNLFRRLPPLHLTSSFMSILTRPDSSVINYQMRLICSNNRRRKLKNVKLRKQIKLAKLAGEKGATIGSPSKVQKKEKKVYSPLLAIQKILEVKRERPESIDVHFFMNVNLKNTSEHVRGVCILPNGSGKSVKLAVFSNKEGLEIAKKMGVEYLGSEELINQIKDGKIEFEKCLATEETMPQIKFLGRILGPKSLMPNKKVKTLVRLEELEQAIKNMKKGQAEFRLNTWGNITASIGKSTFSEEELLENYKAFLNSLYEKKPEKIKTKYFKSAHVTSSQGPSFAIDLNTIDPSHLNYAFP